MGQRVLIVEDDVETADFLAKWRTLPYAGPAYVYTTRDRNTGSGNPDDTFGLYRSDWTPKPAQAAVAALA